MTGNQDSDTNYTNVEQSPSHNIDYLNHQRFSISLHLSSLWKIQIGIKAVLALEKTFGQKSSQLWAERLLNNSSFVDGERAALHTIKRDRMRRMRLCRAGNQ